MVKKKSKGVRGKGENFFPHLPHPDLFSIFFCRSPQVLLLRMQTPSYSSALPSIRGCPHLLRRGGGGRKNGTRPGGGKGGRGSKTFYALPPYVALSLSLSPFLRIEFASRDFSIFIPGKGGKEKAKKRKVETQDERSRLFTAFPLVHLRCQLTHVTATFSFSSQRRREGGKVRPEGGKEKLQEAPAHTPPLSSFLPQQCRVISGFFPLLFLSRSLSNPGPNSPCLQIIN